MDDDFKMLPGKSSQGFKEQEIDIFEISSALVSVYKLRGFSQVCNNIWDIKSKNSNLSSEEASNENFYISEFPSANDALTE